ncbi:MAG: ATP-grasp domain-containing protein [Rhodospirillaceae bacterium]
MKEIVVGITGINSSDNPGPGVGVARSLKEAKDLNVRVVGLAYDAMETGIYLDWIIDRAFIIPYPSSGPDALLNRLRHIKSVAGLDFVIPCLDVELPLYSRIEQALKQEGIGTFLPTSEQFRLRGKDQLLEVAPAIGLELPKTRVVNSYEDMMAALDDLTLPVVVKGAHYNALRAYSSQEAFGCFHSVLAQWGYPIIVQETVTGEELNLIALGDGAGGCLGQVGMKKMWTTSLGKIWTGVTVQNRTMLEAARRFIETYSWRGGFELECIADGEKTYLIEINPRFPAWVYFATAVGVNLPAAMLRAALDLPRMLPESFEAGRLYVRYTEELITDMTSFQKMVTRGES